MSAKNRGGEVIASESYPTPPWATRRILEALRSSSPFREMAPGGRWLEPCAGAGAITDVVAKELPGVRIYGGDILPLPKPASVSEEWAPGRDFRTLQSLWPWEVVITNPPFSLAREVITYFRQRSVWLVLLLRQSFDIAPDRNDMPDEYKLPERPEFIASDKCKGHNAREGGCGWDQKVPLHVAKPKTCPSCGGKVQRSKSDASEYSWYVYGPQRGRSYGLTRVLPSTPLAERRILTADAQPDRS